MHGIWSNRRDAFGAFETQIKEALPGLQITGPNYSNAVYIALNDQVLFDDKVRYVGDQVALVVAETQNQAKDAAELIDVDYDVLPAVVHAVDALKTGAPQIHDEAPGNKCYTWAIGDKAAVDAAFAKAAHVTKLDLVNNRLVPNAIEPRAAVASYNRAEEAYTLYVSSESGDIVTRIEVGPAGWRKVREVPVGVMPSPWEFILMGRVRG